MSVTTTDRLAGDWQLNPVHSTASFSVRYLVATFRGSFSEIDASLDGDILTGSVKVASVKVKDPNLTGHLLSPDFFDAEQFPTIAFRSDPLRIEGDEITVQGELTLKGVTKRIQATGSVVGPVVDHAGSTRLGFSLETTINRTDFGVSFNAPLPTGGKALSDDVALTIELEFNRE
jgi:polyisoprenoid-binding protein YceI